jgi:hypothetical protein
LAKKRPQWRTDDVGCAAASWYVAPTRGTIQAVPRAAGTLFVEFIAKPKADALLLPDFLFDEYGQIIADGAAGRVLRRPDPAFTNPNLATALLTNFESKISELVNEGQQGQQRAPVRVPAQFM